MQKKQIASTEKKPFSRPSLQNKETQILWMIHTISSEMLANPQIYATKDKTIWIYYEHSCFETDFLYENFGDIIADINQKYPISIYGNINEFEGGELSFVLSSDIKNIIYSKLNVSGSDFYTLSDICIKIQLPQNRLIGPIYQWISNSNYQSAYIAMKRSNLSEQIFIDCPQYSTDTWYRYLQIKEDGEFFYLNTLSIEQIKDLWLLFLKENISPIEFDDAFDALKSHTIAAFPWELALRIAISEACMEICYQNNDFQVLNAQGKRMRFSYESSIGAEKLFLKLLFPKD